MRVVPSEPFGNEKLGRVRTTELDRGDPIWALATPCGPYISGQYLVNRAGGFGPQYKGEQKGPS
jgi:hypothetical protein